MASLGCSESYFPEEMALQCLTWVPGAHAHFVISTCCRSFRAVSKDDSLWIGRLRRDFPRCRAQDKAPGRLHITYKILAKSYQSQFSRSKERFGRWQQSSPESQSVKQERSESWWQLMASRPVSKALQPGADVQIQRWRVFVSALARRACDSSFGVSGQYSIAVCDGCGQWCIAGQHYKCAICPDYDLCGACYRRRHELHVAHDEWNRTETGSSSSIAIPQVAEQTRPWVLHASSGMVLTREEVQHHVRRLNASRREEPTQVAAALEAQGCGVSRTIDMFERSLAPIDLPACTFESIGTSTWSSHRQPAKPRLSHAVIPNECTKLNHGSKHMCKEDQCVSLQVIESVAHDEQAAQIDEQEAAEFTALQHADFIERNLGWTSIESAAEVDAAEINCANDALEEQDIVIVGKLNRMSKALQDELNRGAPLRACRDALEEAGHPWKLLSGTMVFVHPWQYRAAISTLSLHELRPYHIVFSESLRYLLEETLAHCKGSWMSACIPVQEQTTSESQIGTSSDAKSLHGKQDCDGSCLSEHDVECVVSVERTFVCVHPYVSLEAHVISSTGGAHNFDHSNPRLVALQRASLWHC